MKKLTRLSGIIAALALGLGVTACSSGDKDEEPMSEADAAVEATTEEETEDAAEEAEEEAEEEGAADGWELSERDGTGPARVDVGFMSFDVGDGVEWQLQSTPETNHYASVIFGTDKSTELEVDPASRDSYEETVEKHQSKLEAYDHPLEDLGEVTLGDLTYHKWARTAPSGAVQIHLISWYEPLKARVLVDTPAAEGTTDFAYPEELDLMFDSLEFYDGPLEDLED